MLGGREKVGAAVVDINSVASMMPKRNRRLTFPFGPATDSEVDGRDTIHEHNLREIPIAEGALGCALWDGGMVLTRILYKRGEELLLIPLQQSTGGSGGGASADADAAGSGAAAASTVETTAPPTRRARVLELGSGVGLCGIMASHFAESVVLTDYIPDALKNALYNVTLNEVDPDEVPDALGSELREAYQFSIEDRVRVMYLDWDAELGRDRNRCGGGQAANNNSNENNNENNNNSEANQNQTGSTSTTIELPEGVEFFSGIAPRSFDVILGAELTYNLLSCESLAHVVDKYLTEDGRFIEVLSNDRDGVTSFVQQIESLGFETQREDVGAEFVGNFGTRAWSKQEMESYSLWTWRRRKPNGGAGGGGAASE